MSGLAATAKAPVAIVTGAGRMRGIGRAIARRLASDGFAIVVHERVTGSSPVLPHERTAEWAGAASVVQEIVDHGGIAVAVAGDLIDRTTAERLVDAAHELGAPSALVNSHGDPGEANAWFAHETPDDVWDATLAINLTSLHRLTSVMVPALADSGAINRSVVHLSSTAGHRAVSRYGAYCASKAAVERLTQQQAIEVARYGVRVNCVAPGSTSTDMIDGTIHRAAQVAHTSDEDLRARIVRTIPLRRFAEPAEIAAAVAFLVGNDAQYVTGQVLGVDGGLALV